MSRRTPVPPVYPGATIVCAASGPSLTVTDLAACAHLPCVTVNDTYQLHPAPAAIFAADARWWARTPAARRRPSYKYCLSSQWVDGADDITVLERTGQRGLELDPTGLRSGGHSGYAAINLAYHLGAATIVLLGYDMQPGPEGQHHWFGEHPDGSHARYEQWLGLYVELTDALMAENVLLLNASPRTAIMGVPICTLEEALAEGS